MRCPEARGGVDIDGTEREIVLRAICLESIETVRRDAIFKNGICTDCCPNQNALRRFRWRTLAHELDDALHRFIAVVYEDDFAAPACSIGEVWNDDDLGCHVCVIGYRNRAQKAVVSLIRKEAQGADKNWQGCIEIQRSSLPRGHADRRAAGRPVRARKPATSRSPGRSRSTASAPSRTP